jgi:DnaK suppressor protein
MDTTHFKRKLIEKERELLADLARIQAEARIADAGEAKDAIDEATTEQGVSETFEEAAVFQQTLQEVQDALTRIKNGTYGKCSVCGRPIEPARLEAVPWALYCLEDQQKRDTRRAAHQGSTL